METGRRLVAILNRQITISIVEKGTFDQILEVGEGDNQRKGNGKD